MMSTTDFDARVREIEAGIAQRRMDADAYRDRELARLFNESGWTQEKIAGHKRRPGRLSH